MNVTYLLGAGASAIALPVVAFLNKRLDEFNKYLEEYKDSPNVAGIAIGLLNKIKDHATIDTYAKKLFLQSGFNNTAKLDLLKLKYYLSLYFIAEQSKFYRDHKIETNQKNGHGFYTLNYLVDPRYDPFLASLLIKKDNRLVLPENINIISWNYDIQLELAYLPFAQCSINTSFSELNVMPPNLALQDGSNVVKLNGTAGLLLEKADSPFCFWKKDNHETTKHDFQILLEDFKKLYIYDESETIGFNNLNLPLVNFAWERDLNTHSEKAIESAKKILENTEILVIIGYTFPNFNRTIDRELMVAARSSVTKIYYQAPEEELKGLIVRLKGIVPKSLREVIESKEGLIEHSDLKQLCIPYEL